MSMLVVSSLVLGAGAAVAEQAQGRRVLRAEITGVEVDPDSHLGDVEGGDVTIDRAAREIQLDLDRAEGSDEYEPPDDYEVDVPILSVKRDGCGGIVYVGERDLRPVDGPLVRIEVTDNRSLICKILRPPTEIRYTDVSSGFGGPVQTTRAYFTAGPLRSVVVRPD